VSPTCSQVSKLLVDAKVAPSDVKPEKASTRAFVVAFIARIIDNEEIASSPDLSFDVHEQLFSL
jgi:hypothetical protein